MSSNSELNLQKLNLAFNGKPAGFFARAGASAFRAKVRGGWLVFAGGTHGIGGVTFYPDPEHRWNGGSER